MPPWTSDTEIETLIERFRKVGRENRSFGAMKIRPTTPEDPLSRYHRITIYIFTLDAWTEAPILHQYLTGEDRDVRDGFRKALRGLYELTESEEEGRIGPLVEGPDTAATAAYSRRLFKGPVGLPSVDSGERASAP